MRQDHIVEGANEFMRRYVADRAGMQRQLDREADKFRADIEAKREPSFGASVFAFLVEHLADTHGVQA